MMRNGHTLKLDISYCDDVVCRRKHFEIRKNDRDYKVGDFIGFKPVQNGSFVKLCF